MPQFQNRSCLSPRLGFIALLATVLLAGCGTTPAPVSGKAQYRQVFDGPVVVEFERDTKLSAVDGVSCYTFLTGTVANQSRDRLSRQTEVHFKVYHDGQLLFSDIARLRADLAPGDRVQFQMVESPVHRKQCPSYDRIDVLLRKIVLP